MLSIRLIMLAVLAIVLLASIWGCATVHPIPYARRAREHQQREEKTEASYNPDEVRSRWWHP